MPGIADKINSQKIPAQWLIILAFAAIYIILCSTYLAILIALDNIPPFSMSAMRFLAAGIILFTWCLYKRERLPSVKFIVNNAISYCRFDGFHDGPDTLKN